MLLLEPLGQTIVQAPLQALKLGRHGGGVEPFFPKGKRETPGLTALFLAERGEEIAEPGEKISLRHQHVDGNAHAQDLVELLHAHAQGLGVRLALRRRLLQKVTHAHRDQHAVDGAARPGFLEELEEALPSRGVDGAVALLGRVSPRRVEEHGLVGEPPIAVAGTAHTADGLAAESVRERKAQPEVDQRGRLAGPGSADEDVPRQIVEVLL